MQYNLPPNDPRFLGLTPEEIEAEYWAYHFKNNPATERSEDDEDFNAEEVAALMESDDWIKVL